MTETITEKVDSEPAELRSAVRRFVDEQVIPAEGQVLWNGSGHSDEDEARLEGVVAELRTEARAAGVFSPTVSPALGGLGLDHRMQAVVLEEAGRSLLGPLAMNCAAPDEGNILLLDKLSIGSQRATYLEPLAHGDIRSSFAMTEPSPGAGADPQRLQTTASQVCGGWRIDGRKWFITGARGAGFFIVMARTGDAGSSMFLVAGDHPGLRIERAIRTMDTVVPGGHAEVVFDDCRVPDSAVLGRIDEGFAHAQVRLAPARLTHCMRWLGAARRAHEIAVARSANRPMFGTVLSELGMAQKLIADNEIDIAASRSMIQDSATVLDLGGNARRSTSMTKVFVSEAVSRIVDRSVQLCGALGVSEDEVVGAIYQEIRPFRIYDGPSEVHRWSIARRAAKLSVNGQLPGDVN